MCPTCNFLLFHSLMLLNLIVFKHLTLYTLALQVVLLWSFGTKQFWCSHSECPLSANWEFLWTQPRYAWTVQVWEQAITNVPAIICIYEGMHINSLVRIVTFKSLAIKFVLSDFMAFNVDFAHTNICMYVGIFATLYYDNL